MPDYRSQLEKRCLETDFFQKQGEAHSISAATLVVARGTEVSRRLSGYASWARFAIRVRTYLHPPQIPGNQGV
jgi:hypothetical protein